MDMQPTKVWTPQVVSFVETDTGAHVEAVPVETFDREAPDFIGKIMVIEDTLFRVSRASCESAQGQSWPGERVDLTVYPLTL